VSIANALQLEGGTTYVAPVVVSLCLHCWYVTSRCDQGAYNWKLLKGTTVTCTLSLHPSRVSIYCFNIYIYFECEAAARAHQEIKHNLPTSF